MRPLNSGPSRLLPIALGIASFVFATNASSRVIVDGTEYLVTSESAIDSYQVVNGGTLKLTSGSRADAINVLNSAALMDGATVIGTGNYGVRVSSAVDPTRPASAVIRNSSITSANFGVGVGALSKVELEGSSVDGTGQNGAGLVVFAGEAEVKNGSKVTGQQNGVRFSNDASPGGGDVYTEGKLTIDGSTIEGIAGPAVLVNGTSIEGSQAEISVTNGSTLIGGNGVLLEVSRNSSAALTVDSSSLQGDVVVDVGSTARVVLQNNAILAGNLSNVSNIAVNSGATWSLTSSTLVGDASLDRGTVILGDGNEFRTLTLGSLSGNGTFVMNTDLAAGQGDLLRITGATEGQHELSIKNSGAEPSNGGSPLKVVETGTGAGQFVLSGGKVDAGTYQYTLQQQASDWYLVQSTAITPSTGAVLGLFGASPTVWYGEHSTLRTRLGDIRLSNAGGGAWARTFGSRFNVSPRAGQAYEQNQYGFALGADGRVSGGDSNGVLVGAFVGYSNNALDFGRGTSGTVDSFFAGAYSTWTNDKGYYVDAVLKTNIFRNDARVLMTDGQRASGAYTSYGIGGSLEIGRHVPLGGSWYVEPFGQMASMHVLSKDVSLSNGMQANADANKSFMATVGVSVGKNLQRNEGTILQPYVTVAAVQEFAQGNRVYVNGNRFDNDLDGVRMELKTGIAAQVKRDLQAHAHLTFSKGAKLSQPWGFNIGVRYSW